MRKIMICGCMIALLTVFLVNPTKADLIMPEKAFSLSQLDSRLSDFPASAIPYIRGLADSKHPNKLTILKHYYELALELLKNPKMDINLRGMNPQNLESWKRQMMAALEIFEANIRIVEAEMQPQEIARKIYIEMVNDESKSIRYRAEALRRLEDDPPKEVAESLPIFLPTWKEVKAGRLYMWKVHPETTLRAVRMMKKVCGKDILPLLDDWLRNFQTPNLPLMSWSVKLHDALVDLYWDLRFSGLTVEEQIKIATEELFEWKGHGLMPREAFIKIGKPALPTLIELLYIPDNRINGSAEYALAKIKDERAVEHLERIIDDPIINPTPTSKSHTIWAIGEIGGPKAVIVLKQLLKRKGEHPFVIQETLNSLGKIGDTSSEELILPFLEHTDGNVRYCAAKALKTCGTQKAVSFLLKRFEVETEPGVRVAIIQALKALGVQVKN
ncbi:MAG: HEAT repeat domain-containing protein [Armatimonadota bacterium]|nr:HEAT repeat domain-containing protein [Armatimonadota bacterium]